METGKGIKNPAQAEPMLSTYLHRKGRELGLPVGGTFELTARCNFNCKMCYVHLKEDQIKLQGQELTADQWLSIASDARDMGMVFLLLTGGEPFLREDFPYIYTELIKMGMVVSINTNASLYNEDLRQLFRRYPPSRINVTLYGGSEETYSNLCGNASFGRVVRNLRSMCEDRLQLRLNVSLTPDNVGDLEKIDEISRELKLLVKVASYMYPPVRVNGMLGQNVGRFAAREAGCTMAKWYYLRDSAEQFQVRVERIRKMQSAGITENCVDVEQEGVRCRAGRSSFWLTWDGKMTPCGTMDVEPAYPLRDGFAVAWNEVRERTAAIRLPKECAGCQLKANCGVCAAVCKSETGAFDQRPDYMCEMTKATASEILARADERKEGEA